MLIEFSTKNFRSIKDEQKLSLVSSKYKELNSNISRIDKFSLDLVNSCAIYGANSAGKSNIIKALRTMQRIVIESASESQRGEELEVEPFLLNKNNKKNPTEFEVIFIKDDIRYQYGFSATKERIYEEWLIVFETKRPQYWFERFYDEESSSYSWKLGDKLKGQKKVWQNATKDNSLFLSTAVNLNSKQLSPVFDWFKKTLHIAGVNGWGSSFTETLCKDESEKRKILEFLHNADIDIDDIKVEIEDFDIDKLPSDVPSELKDKLIKDLKNAKVIDTKIIRLDNDGESVEFDLEENESDGTQKLFAFAGPWLDTLEKGNVLFIDELHDNFHPLLVKYLVELFHNKNINKNNAQLIFTTHETSILNQDIFRRDQVWFCEKDENKSTILYPLTDFSPRKNDENLEKSYFSGRYGALPYLKEISKNMSVGIK